MNVDVVVSGAGIVGLCTAIAMQQRGYCVAVLDAGDCSVPKEENFQRMYAINAASQNLLQSLGIWSELEHRNCTPYRKMKVSDQRSGASIHFDCRSLALSELGHIIGEITLKKALLAMAKQLPQLHLFPTQTISAYTPTDTGISLSTKDQRFDSKVLLVAEGAMSATRALLGVQVRQWSYHQQAIIAQVQTQKAHQNIARQIFLPSGPLAFLPLPDPHRCSIVWSAKTAKAKHLQTLSAASFNQQLSDAFKDELGQITLSTKRHSFALTMRHVKQYSGDSWALLGDSAHTIHPFAGLGLNIGLADVQALIHCLDASAARFFSKRNLNAYHRQRSAQLWNIILGLQGLKFLFDSPLSPIVHLRGLGLNAVDQCGPVKRLFMEQAIGV